MALYLDVHNHLPEGATAEDVAGAHAKDLEVQEKYGVTFLRYWLDETQGKISCLVDAPDPETANRVHLEAHGLVADESHEVIEGA